MKKVLISVIVPIYNAEKYLCACIDSILAQTLMDFELLLINDASTDNSLEICNQYADKDSRTIVFNQLINKGVCVSRNIGIENARGKYIVCIDADDVVLENHLSSLYFSSRIPSGALVHSPHFVSSNGVLSDINCNVEPYLIDNLFNNKINKFDYLFAGPAWSKLIETEILIKNKIRFRPGVKINEDHIFHLEYLMHINSYKYTGEKTYIYVDNSDSISKKYFPFEECFQRVQLMIPLTQNVIERFQIQDKLVQVNLYSTPINALFSSIFSLYLIPFKKAHKDRIICLTEISNNYSYYMNNYWLPQEVHYKLLKHILKLNNIKLIDFCLSIMTFIKYEIFNKFK